MKERPILFSAPMVRAILAGHKTMTRRIVKPQPPEGHSWSGWCISSTRRADEGKATWARGEYPLLQDPHRVACPYGNPGDRLWVRETWAEVGTCDPGLIVYRADYPECVPSQYENVPPASAITWKPSIHMFRRHSRITLEITAVRVEHLQDISQADAIAEGIARVGSGYERFHVDPDAPVGQPFTLNSVLSFRGLWESINGPEAWNANPWVWVIEFKRVEAA